MVLHQNVKLLCFKGHHQESKKMIHRKGENYVKQNVRQGACNQNI